MVEYISIEGASQGRQRSYILCLTGIKAALVALIASIALILIVIVNMQYYQLFRDLPKVYRSLLKYGSIGGDEDVFRLVCYYRTPSASNPYDDLHLKDINDGLCTHVNIGSADVNNCTLSIDKDVDRMLREEVPLLRKQNPNTKILLWVGGGDIGKGFVTMVRTHETRKIFIKSLKAALRKYNLDGVDLDWEFPSAYDKERQHFSQLLYEIKEEYKRERRDYLLTVAVAAIEGIAFYAYDIRELNLYADFVNLMTYDYHFFSRSTPFTGLNAPLYARENEKSIMGIMNINSSVNWWLSNGLHRKKLVVGLPTYGHSFTLVNPFNNGIGAPASDFGLTGIDGFTSYTEICDFMRTNVGVTIKYDNQTCSPYLHSVLEWISFENEESIKCKTQYVKSMELGGVMIFSINTDDYKGFCQDLNSKKDDKKGMFPLINTVRRTLTN